MEQQQPQVATTDVWGPALWRAIHFIALGYPSVPTEADAVSYRAFRLSLGGKEAPVVNGITGDQRFFYSWASFARGKVRPEELRRRIATDPHSPYEFRCNQVVKNIPQFYSAFGVSETDGMWLDEKSRVQIW